MTVLLTVLLGDFMLRWLRVRRTQIRPSSGFPRSYQARRAPAGLGGYRTRGCGYQEVTVAQPQQQTTPRGQCPP